tara:strand:+ start:1481 stop:1804 length:324 start_codon:yes stop_codon:yes gene_type:complete
MSWSVVILNDLVEAEIVALPNDIQADFYRLVELIHAVGLENIGRKRSRHLRGKLWELRLSGRDGIGRTLYVTASGRRVVILHAFVKKSQKAPAAALEIAEKRLKEVE